MNKKGFAATGILYTILILFILLMAGILTMLYSRNNLLSTIKNKVKSEIETGALCSNMIGTVWNFDYTGGEQIFTAPCAGTYTLETWGASGGYAYDESRSTGGGGYGGYSIGNFSLDNAQQLFVNVGGEGKSNCQNTNCLGGYNGGSDSNKWASGDGTGLYTGGGGGATHIATTTGLLYTLEESKSSVLIVSGGGGGGDYYPSWSYRASGGSGGGYIGVDGEQGSGTLVANTGGTQTSGYDFGQAGTTYTSDSVGGSGGGWYGGISKTMHTSGAGGSGYIGNSLLLSSDGITKHMTCYNCTTSTDSDTKTQTTTNVSADAISDYAKKGNGYAKITLVSID